MKLDLDKLRRSDAWPLIASAGIMAALAVVILALQALGLITYVGHGHG